MPAIPTTGLAANKEVKGTTKSEMNRTGYETGQIDADFLAETFSQEGCAETFKFACLIVIRHRKTTGCLTTTTVEV